MAHFSRSVGFLSCLSSFHQNDGVNTKNTAYQSDAFGIITRKGSERKLILNLLRLILWDGGKTETDYPIIGELPEPDGNNNSERIKPMGGKGAFVQNSQKLVMDSITGSVLVPAEKSPPGFLTILVGESVRCSLRHF